MKNRNLKRVVVLLGMALLAVILLRPVETQAGIYDASGEVTYKEYWVPHTDYTGGCGDNEKPFGNAWYLEPWGCDKEISFNIPDNFSNALKAEIYIDLWRNHDSKEARFSLNGAPMQQPNVGSAWSRTPYVGPINLSDLVIGKNIITWGHGGYHVHDVAIRIYYDDTHPLIAGPGGDTTPPDGELLTVKADGSEISANTGGTLVANANQLTLKANVSDGAKYVEFHGYYFGFDEDADGQLRDWHNRNHNNWNPDGTNPKANGGTIDHLGTKSAGTAGEYSVTKDISHIPDQDGMKFKIRIVDAAGNVREAAGGVSKAFTLSRTQPLVAFWNPDFVDAGLWMEGTKPVSVNRNFYLPTNFDSAEYVSGMVVHSFWNGAIMDMNFHGQNIWPNFIGSDHWFMSVQTFNHLMLWPGLNKITYSYNNPGDLRPGAFVENPGPFYILKQKTWAFDNTDPTLFNLVPVKNQADVSPGTKIQAQVVDTQSGLDYSTLKMKVQGVTVTPQITGAANTALLVYRPTVGFDPAVTVTVNIEGCDLESNCFDEMYTFDVEGETEPTDIESDDFNSCNLDQTIWEFRDPIGDSNYTMNGAEVSINLPAGSNHDLWVGANNAPRLMQSANDTDFRIKAKFNSEINQNQQMQGLLVGQDAQNFLRIGMRYDGTDGYLEVYAFEDGSPVTKLYLTLAEPLPSEVIIERFGNNWRYSYLNQADQWVIARNFDFNMTVNEVGVFAGNYGTPASNAPAFSSKVDFFFDDNNPIDPQDPNPLHLPVEIVGGGTVSKNPVCGNPVTLTAVADSGYFFDGWTSATGAISGRTNPLSTSFTVSETLTATFRVDALTLDVDVVNNGPGTGGSVTITPDKAVYNYGDNVTVIPNTPEGWDFMGWSGDVDAGDQNDNPLLITMDDDIDITATFEAEAVTLTVSEEGQGSVDVDPDQGGNYQYGDQVKLTAVPAQGWVFDNWTGVDAGQANSNPLNYVMNGNASIKAIFVEGAHEVYLPILRP